LNIYQTQNIYAIWMLRAFPTHFETTIRSTGIPVLVHMTSLSYDQWGESFAFVSNWLSDYCSNGTVPCVPHIVELPDKSHSIRSAMGVNDSEVLIGRIGGGYSWNIHFVNPIIREVVELRNDIQFALINIPQIHHHLKHERIKIFNELPYDQQLKAAFISSCDAMIHARGEGESFGISVGEFSKLNKPIIPYRYSFERAHLEQLNKHAITFDSPETLRSLLLIIGKNSAVDWNRYDAFNEKSVVEKFCNVFLKYHPQLT
jgi:hypothetical protein